MKYRLMDLLACPICKHWPLELIPFTENRYNYENLPNKIPYCKDYCGLNKAKISELKIDQLNCKECVTHEIAEGILICNQCGRWYPITEEIPIMLPDPLRNGKEDLDFLKKWTEKIPEKVLKEGKPIHL
ncbi:MAG: Trm112 family protein [Thermoprotei archaeon]